LSKRGAGVGIDFTLLPDGGTLIDNTFHSNSKIDWIKALIDTSQKVSQGGVRRGYATPFESIESETFEQLLKEVDKNNPDKTSVLIDNTVGCVIPEGFIGKIESGDKVAQRKFLNLLNERKKSGQIYISYVENMNKNCSEVYKKLGYIIKNSNICQEFCQPYMQGYTPVCVIGAINLMKWGKVKEDPQIIKDIIYFLNIMNEEYVLLTKDQPGLERAHAAARDKKDIGLGTLGLHSLFQSKGMAFGSVESRLLNKEIYSTIQKYSIEASEELADLLGPCKFAKEAGMNRRNCSLNMVAPNKSSSFFNTIDEKGTPASLGIEPYFSNIFTKRLAKIQYTFKNPFLERLLEEIVDFEIEIFINDKNDVHFMLTKDGVQKLLKSGSGFEKTASSLALRAVLGKISTLPMPNFITFDEVLGKVAPENLEKLKTLFEKISDMYEIVFFITHNDLVKDWSDNILTVVKDNNISKVKSS
jgi:ribonucleoside-diphosphate reductase alpha chain